MKPHSDNIIYLDCNATTAVLPPISQAVMHALEVGFGNPSSSHITGLKARRLMEKTREMGKQLIGAKEGRLIFTSGATEGIQTAVVSALLEAKTFGINHPVILYGATEHKAVPNTLKHWNDVLDVGAEIIAIPVNKKGILDQQFIEQYSDRALMVCTMIVNNETGVFQDIPTLEKVIKKAGSRAFWMVDCVQGLGKQTLDLANTKIDYAPFSGHKLYAPKGIGFLYINQHAPFTPFIAGGGQESGARSGTENIPGIAGLNKLFELMLSTTDSPFKSIDTLAYYRSLLAQAVKDTFEDVVFNHDFDCSVATTLNFSVANLFGAEVMNLFDSVGIRVSAGSACSSGAASSFVLDAMGLSPWQSENAIRMSFGPVISEEEVANACERIRALKTRLKDHCLINRNDGELACAVGINEFESDGQRTILIVNQQHKGLLINPNPNLNKALITLCQRQGITLEYITSFNGDNHAKWQQPFASVANTQTEWSDAQSKLTFGHFCITREHNGDFFDYHVTANEMTHLVLSHDEFKKPGNIACDISCEALEQLFAQTPEIQVIDTREPYESDLDEIAEVLAITNNQLKNIPVNRLLNAYSMGDIAPETPYLLLCRSGKRSDQALQKLNQMGFERVYNLAGGIAELL